MIEMHVGQEQVIHRLALDAEFRQRGEHQRDGGIGAGIDDRGP